VTVTQRWGKIRVENKKIQKKKEKEKMREKGYHKICDVVVDNDGWLYTCVMFMCLSSVWFYVYVLCSVIQDFGLF